jgi:hypothetical protein
MKPLSDQACSICGGKDYALVPVLGGHRHASPDVCAYALKAERDRALEALREAQTLLEEAIPWLDHEPDEGRDLARRIEAALEQAQQNERTTDGR